MKAVGTFVCPSTKNTIRTTWITTNPNAPNGRYLQDLSNNSVNTQINGDSYELFGTFNPDDGIDTHGKKKTEAEALAHLSKNYTSTKGTRPGPSAYFLVMDGDDTSSDPGAAPNNKINNWPEKGNNHGDTGACANFCDGHAEFIPLKKFLHVWNLSQDSNRAAP